MRVCLCLPALGWRVLAAPQPRTCTDCVLQRSRHNAPNDGASTRLLAGLRVLGHRHLHCVLHWSHRHEAPSDEASLRLLDSTRRRRTQAPCTCNILCIGATIMKLRLMEQACGC